MREASNPGLRVGKRPRRVTSSPGPTDSDLSAFLDGFEQDLCPVVSDGVGTQVLPTVTQSPGTTLAEESCKPTQFEIEGVLDTSVNDSCDEEVPGAVTCVHRASRRRLVLVSTQFGSTGPTVEDIDCPWVDAHVDGSDTENVDDHIVVVSQREDAQSVEESPSEVNKEDDGRDLQWWVTFSDDWSRGPLRSKS